MLPSQPRPSGGLPSWCPALLAAALACALTGPRPWRFPPAASQRPTSARPAPPIPRAPGVRAASASPSRPSSPLLPRGTSSSPMSPTADSLMTWQRQAPAPHLSRDRPPPPAAPGNSASLGPLPLPQSSPPDFPMTPASRPWPPCFWACVPAILLPLSLSTPRRPTIAGPASSLHEVVFSYFNPELLLPLLKKPAG